MKTFKTMAAQGDMLLRRVDAIPTSAVQAKTEKGAFVLAHSETGHNHIVMERPGVTYFNDPSNPFRSWLHVDGSEMVEIKHLRSFDTHETITVPPGIYEVRRQREYTPEGFRAAAD